MLGLLELVDWHEALITLVVVLICQVGEHQPIVVLLWWLATLEGLYGVVHVGWYIHEVWHSPLLTLVANWVNQNWILKLITVQIDIIQRSVLLIDYLSQARELRSLSSVYNWV